ncbi:hypothetical protein BDA96_01G176500 [Sorghum bicolor]|uniref:Uncharacterized protein n=3 Tax=Sorghum bicolor TaxID=4558 RepID=A0A921S125_SORBI|nr:hypothetical protein BDA96_01G176500 [Sorghum bicolor]OQU91378.1 hypothetical protein SORBI_3001G168700 [Sorghum bicolor]
MHRPRLNPPTPLAAAGVPGATATPGPGPRRILCPSSRASPNITTAGHHHQHRRRGCVRPSTPARTSFSFYSASPETSAAAIDSRAATPCPRPVPFLEPRTSPPGTTEGPGIPPNPFCFQALALALPDRRQAKTPAAVVKHALLPPPARKVVVVKKGAAVMGGGKAAGKQEDVHKLRILENRYMQYRFLNAQAEAMAITKKAVAEESLYGLSERIANLQKSVAQKKAELECLKRMEKIDFVVDAQVPSLEQWCELEREHISCLASGTVSLLNAASRLPTRGNIKTNTGRVKLALNCAMEIMKQLSPFAEKLSRKVEEIEDVASELNNVVSEEQVLLQECTDLLHQAHDMQVMEDGLRIQVMQLKNQTKNKT